MSGSTPRLGRGLAALLGESPAAPASSTAPRASLPVTALVPGPFQPRQGMDPGQLADLAASIQQQGVLQPILARPHPTVEGQFQIIGGERRWRAAQLAGLHEVPVFIRPLTDSEAMAAALVENLQREDLDPIEEAEGYRRLTGEFGLTQDQLGGLVGKSRSHVANTLRLLQLPDSLRAHVQSGALTAGHARALLSHPAPEIAARTVMARGLNVRQTEQLTTRSTMPIARPPQAAPDPETVALEHSLAARLGLRVQVVSNPADGAGGSVRIHYRTLDQLEGLITLLTRD